MTQGGVWGWVDIDKVSMIKERLAPQESNLWITQIHDNSLVQVRLPTDAYISPEPPPVPV